MTFDDMIFLTLTFTVGLLLTLAILRWGVVLAAPAAPTHHR